MIATPKIQDAGRLRVGPYDVRYVRRGTERGQPGDLPILVLHGWGAHLEAVEPILVALEGAADVVALDMPGFGESDPPAEGWDADSYAEFVLAFLTKLEIDRCHVIGHSHGGRVGICLAADHPERVDRLLLCDSAGLRPKRGLRYHRRVAAAKLGRLAGRLGGPPGRRLQERLRRRVASRDYLEAPEAMRATFRMVIAQDLAERLPRIKAPTLLVWGDEDEDTPLWMAHRMEELIPDAGLVVLEGAGHYSYVDAPGAFGSVARRFLSEQPREVRGLAAERRD
jgi:pimeloyl-ACP methyl ester carboxylesterase